MQTISTKILNASATMGRRIKAQIESGRSITRPYDYGTDLEGNYVQVARELYKELGWDKIEYTKMVGGHVKHGMVFVFVATNPRTNEIEYQL